MMERVTHQTIQTRADNLNRRLELTGRYVFVQSRNGYTAVDEYRLSDGACVRHVTAGTKREVADFLHAMMVGIDMVCP